MTTTCTNNRRGKVEVDGKIFTIRGSQHQDPPTPSRLACVSHGALQKWAVSFLKLNYRSNVACSRENLPPQHEDSQLRSRPCGEELRPLSNDRLHLTTRVLRHL